MRNKLITIIIISLIAGTIYYLKGNYQGVYNATLLTKINEDNNIQELINGLQSQLKTHGDDAINLALLGKLYLTEGNYLAAKESFEKAYALSPDDPDLLIDYTSAYYLAENGNINSELAFLIKKVADLPHSLESLSLLANIAFASGDATRAISYWKTMQTLLPPDDPMQQEIAQLIDFAK